MNSRRVEAAEARGYDPHPDDTAPVPDHLVLPPEHPWMVALEASKAEVAAARDGVA